MTKCNGHIQGEPGHEEIFFCPKCQYIALQAENERLRDAIQLLQEYRKLLGDEINEIVGYAYTHGWKSKRVEQGKKLREKIDQALKGESDG